MDINLEFRGDDTQFHHPAWQIAAQTRDNPSAGSGQVDAYAWTGHYNVDRSYVVNGLNQYTQAGSTTFGYDPGFRRGRLCAAI